MRRIVQAGYRALAPKYHPDSKGSADDFRLLQQSRDGLMDLVANLERLPSPKRSVPRPRTKSKKVAVAWVDLSVVDHTGQGLILISPVTILAEHAVSLKCRIGSAIRFVPKVDVAPDSEVHHVGDVGGLILNRAAADRLRWGLWGM